GRAAAGAVTQRLRLSKAIRERLAQALSQPFPVPASGMKAARALRYATSAETFRDRALIAWAGTGGAAADDDAWGAVVGLAEWEPPHFPLRAADAVARGVGPGPALGELLRSLEAWWIEGDFTADRDDCLAGLGRRLGAK